MEVKKKFLVCCSTKAGKFIVKHSEFHTKKAAIDYIKENPSYGRYLIVETYFNCDFELKKSQEMKIRIDKIKETLKPVKLLK